LQNFFTNRTRLRRGFFLGAAALLSACAIHLKSESSSTSDQLLQRMLVAEDARGTGAEGLAPLWQCAASSG
jgi:hypothetical protein